MRDLQDSGMVQKQAGSSLEEVCFGALLEGFHNRPVTPKVAGKAGKRGGSLGGRVSESLTMFRTFWAIPEAARKEGRGWASEAGSPAWE